jgi:dihydrolipoamide dehydrogenase
VGDCNGRALFTHMAKYQARVAADVILGHPASAISDLQAVPRVTFTDPQVCAVELTEEQARRAGYDVGIVRYDTGGVAGASVLGDSFIGSSQLVIDQSRRVLVEATFVGPGTQEILHSATIAITGQVPIERLWHAVPSFPTVSEVWLRLLEAYRQSGTVSDGGNNRDNVTTCRLRLPPRRSRQRRKRLSPAPAHPHLRRHRLRYHRPNGSCA